MRWYKRSYRVVLGILLGILLLSSLPGSKAQAQTEVLTFFYFAQTGHYLGGVFRDFWQNNGGVERFGYPITEEYIRNGDGKLVQYFERARFELRNENNRSFVDLGLLGREYISIRGDIFAPIAAFPNTASARYFPETGHSIRGLFKTYWERNNGFTFFGYPISEEFVEQFPDGSRRVVQYFERVRFELHDNRVLLGLLGSILAPCQLTPPRPPNTPPTGPVPEGDNSQCPLIVPVAVGRVYPYMSVPGTTLGFEARGYQPGETISLWLNLPDTTVRELDFRPEADPDGGLLVGFRTFAGDPAGRWSIVGRGLSSGRQVVATFELQR